MVAQSLQRDALIEEILDCEWNMFTQVKASEPAACQEQPKTFRLMRWMSHSALPDRVLQSYWLDLQNAERKERNLLTEKYARMENKIPSRNDNPLIKRILDKEVEWMKTLTDEYPLTLRGQGDNFRIYAAAELETYSDHTLELYYEAVLEAEREKRNMVEERYNNLFQRVGYESLESREVKARIEYCRKEGCLGCQ